MIIESISDMHRLRDELRSQNKTVVFTNGVFDILHAGHVTYLEAARALGDVLIVGVNTDESVRELKGESRPVNTLADRLTVLAGLRAVDHVIAFAESTPINVITELLPDILVKGNDYTRDTVVGADVVEAGGGRVVLIPLLEGRSTTLIISRAQKA